MGKHLGKSKTIHIDRALLRSPAFRGLDRIPLLVYLDFLNRRQMVCIKHKGREDTYVIANNGQIVYTYKEAEGRGFGRASFRNAIDKLIERGFIDIAHQGSGGRSKDATLFSISERWKDWNTPNFQPRSRPPDKRKGRGWSVIMSDPERRAALLEARKKK